MALRATPRRTIPSGGAGPCSSRIRCRVSGGILPSRRRLRREGTAPTRACVGFRTTRDAERARGMRSPGARAALEQTDDVTKGMGRRLAFLQMARPRPYRRERKQASIAEELIESRPGQGHSDLPAPARRIRSPGRGVRSWKGVSDAAGRRPDPGARRRVSGGPCRAGSFRSFRRPPRRAPRQRWWWEVADRDAASHVDPHFLGGVDLLEERVDARTTPSDPRLLASVIPAGRRCIAKWRSSNLTVCPALCPPW